MPTSSEKRALIFLAALAALGVSVRAFRASGRPDDATRSALDSQIAAVDSATSRLRTERGGRKRALSRRRADAADSVERAGAHTAPPAPAPRPTGDPDVTSLYERRRREVAESNRASQLRLDEMSKVITVTPKAPASTSAPEGRSGREPIDLDTADEATIATVPWIGPALARRIVDDRMRRGTFGSLEGLQRVAGIGPGLAGRVAPRVRFSGSGMGPPKLIRFRKMRP